MPASAGVVFQEDRLCEEFSATDNVAMIFRKPDTESIRREQSILLPADELTSRYASCPAACVDACV